MALLEPLQIGHLESVRGPGTPGLISKAQGHVQRRADGEPCQVLGPPRSRRHSPLTIFEQPQKRRQNPGKVHFFTNNTKCRNSPTSQPKICKPSPSFTHNAKLLHGNFFSPREQKHRCSISLMEGKPQQERTFFLRRK